MVICDSSWRLGSHFDHILEAPHDKDRSILWSFLATTELDHKNEHFSKTTHFQKSTVKIVIWLRLSSEKIF